MIIDRIDSTIEILSDRVIKTFNAKKFDDDRYYQRKGSLFFLRKHKSDFFIEIKDILIEDKGYVMERFGHSLGEDSGFCLNRLFDVNIPSLILWLKGLKEELIKLNLLHRDIHPANILSTGNNFKLIDFAWMTNRDDMNILKYDGCLNNTYTIIDDTAIEKMILFLEEYMIKLKENIDYVKKEFITKVGTNGYKDGSSLGPDWLYEYLPFYGFEDVKVNKGSCVNEYKIIENYIYDNITDLDSLIDIGCSNGYFLFKFSSLFKKVIGIESDETVYNLISVLKGLYEFNNVELFLGNFNEEHIKENFDVMLMMNTHMWMHKQMGDVVLMDLMKECAKKTKHLFFQTAHAESGGMYKVDSLKNLEDIISYLIECGFTDIQKINTSSEHGGIRYLIYAKGIKNEI